LNWFLKVLFAFNLNRCGTESASTVQTATGHWIQYWRAMVQTVKYTARHAMERSLAPKALVMVMLLLLCPPMENQPYLSKFLSKYIF